METQGRKISFILCIGESNLQNKNLLISYVSLRSPYMQYRINRINIVQNKSVTSKSQGICGQRYKNGGLGQSQSLDGSSILSIKVGVYCFCFSVPFPPNTKCSKQDSCLQAFLGNFITKIVLSYPASKDQSAVSLTRIPVGQVMYLKARSQISFPVKEGGACQVEKFFRGIS